MSKKCTKCNEEKPLEAFVKDKYKSDGYSSNCKACRKATSDARKAVRAEYDRQYNADNQDRIKVRRKKYRQENKAAIAAFQKQRYEEKKDSILLQKKDYRKEICENLTDAYVKQQIVKSGWLLPTEEIPLELIKIKRLVIIANRNIRKMKNIQND